MEQKNKYLHPESDKILKEKLGFIKFEDTNVFFRKELDKYKIVFEPGLGLLLYSQEKMYNEGDITLKQLKEITIHFDKIASVTYCKELTYELLLMLSADYYYHCGNIDKHNEYKNRYEELSHKPYN